MAARYAVASTDFALASTWDGGLSVPGVGDSADCRAFTVPITTNIACDALIATTAGAGGFSCSTAGVVITAAVTATVRTVLTLGHSSGTVTVTGAVTGGSTASAYGLRRDTTGAIVITGTVTGGSGANAYGALVANSGSITINGDVLGGSGSTAAGIAPGSAMTVTVNGNVTGGSNSGAVGIWSTAASTLTVSGTVTGGSAAGAYGISNASTGTVTVNTAVVGGTNATAYGVYNSSSGIVTVNGTVTGSANSIGVYSLAAGAIIVTGTVTGGGVAWNADGIRNGGLGAVHCQGNTVVGSVPNAFAIRNLATGLITVRGTVGAGSISQEGGGTTYNNIVYAVKTGNWSDTTVWSTGALPGATTQVDSSGYTVTIDQNVTVVALFGSAPAAGGFLCSTARTITADVRATVRTCLTLSHSGVTVNVAGNVYGGSYFLAPNPAIGVLSTLSSTTNITGNLTAGGASYCHAFQNNGAGSVSITGNCTGGTGSDANAVNVNANATIAIVGNVTGGSSGRGLFTNAVSTVTVNGNSTGGTGTSTFGIYNYVAATITVNGQAIGGTGASAFGAYNAAGGSLTVTTAVGNNFGPGGGTNSAAGVYGSNTAGAITRVYRAISGPYGQAACAGAVTMVSDPATNTSTWEDALGGADVVLRVLSGAVYISPNVFAVRGGVRIRPLIGGIG